MGDSCICPSSLITFSSPHGTKRIQLSKNYLKRLPLSSFHAFVYGEKIAQQCNVTKTIGEEIDAAVVLISIETLTSTSKVGIFGNLITNIFLDTLVLVLVLESGSSDDPCSEIYQGTGPFSEPETRAIRDAILSRRYKGRVDGFITLHTYSQIWIHPYGHRKDSYPGDIQELYDVGKKAAKALQDVYGTKYVVGSGADTLYPASGGSEDWAKHAGGVKYVYLLELRPDEKNWDGFILGESELIPTARETWEGVKVVAEAVLE
ncbi:unnamed protein product, partial [Strongylus vulgaris]